MFPLLQFSIHLGEVCPLRIWSTPMITDQVRKYEGNTQLIWQSCGMSGKQCLSFATDSVVQSFC